MAENTTPTSKPIEGKVVNMDKTPYTYEEPRPMTKAEVGVVGGFVVAVVAGFAWLVKNDMKNQEKWAAEAKAEREEADRKREEARKAREEWFASVRADGKIVVETRDGMYMAIPAEAYAKAEVKKKGQWL